MDIFVYGYYILGSFSLGYGLLRTGFPNSQLFDSIKKILIGFGIGFIIVGIAIIANITMQTAGFFYILMLLIATLFSILYIKRVSLQELDPEIIIEKRTARIIPDTQIKKDETTGPKINFEQGLIIKGKNKQNGKIEKEVLKGEETNIITSIEGKTNEFEKENEDKQKNAALTRLRDAAKQISQTKKEDKKKEEDELEEDLLNNLGEEKSLIEEEY